MNALPPRPMTPDEAGQAADIYIPKAELERLYAAASARRGKAEASKRRRERLKTALIAGQCGVIACMGLAVARLADQYRVEVVHTYQRDDGTITNTANWASLPESVKIGGAKNVLWEYVRLREGYDAFGAQRAWNVVSALSSPEVRKEYQAWASADNPRSPRRLYGERDVVDVNLVGLHPVCTRDPCDEETSDTLQFRFERRERVAGAWGKPEIWSATARFRRLSDEARKRLPWQQVATFNGAAIQVTGYSGGKPEAVEAAIRHGGSR